MRITVNGRKLSIKPMESHISIEDVSVKNETEMNNYSVYFRTDTLFDNLLLLKCVLVNIYGHDNFLFM